MGVEINGIHWVQRPGFLRTLLQTSKTESIRKRLRMLLTENLRNLLFELSILVLKILVVVEQLFHLMGL